jgi:regulator of protease activity HflC (stomatin/prohibitin superfamily)
MTMSIMTAVLGAVLLIAIAGLRIAQEYQRSVVFRLGRVRSVKGPGVYWIIPLLEWQRKLDIRTRTVTVEQQETITRDSVTIKVDAVLWYRIFDPKKAIIFVQDYRNAVYQVALTSLRNIIGQHVLDEVLTERNTINDTLRTIVDEATAPWGINIEMVEMKDVEIPESMQRAMAREAEAVREKRARLIKSEAEAEASQKLAAAATAMEGSAALELRRMQMVSEIGAENNSTTVILLPSEITAAARGAVRALAGQG